MPSSTRDEPQVVEQLPRFYTVGEVAAMTRMSPVTIYRAISDDEFPAVRVRGKLSIPAKAIEAVEDAATDGQAVVDSADFVRSDGLVPHIEARRRYRREKGRPRPGANQTGAGSFSTQHRTGYGEDATPAERPAQAGGAR